MSEYRCADECGAVVETPPDQVAGPPGWRYLEGSKRWRCSACGQALDAAMHYTGTEPQPFTDPLPPDSRGALPKETASTISAPSVRG